jgi:hypothetical protein
MWCLLIQQKPILVQLLERWYLLLSSFIYSAIGCTSADGYINLEGDSGGLQYSSFRVPTRNQHSLPMKDGNGQLATRPKKRQNKNT